MAIAISTDIGGTFTDLGLMRPGPGDITTTRSPRNWRPNSVFVPPDMWWHQHFNFGRDAAR